MRLHYAITLVLGGLTLLALGAAVGLGLALAAPSARARLRSGLVGLQRHPIGWAAAVSLVAVSGSLYLSEIAGFAPCELCWYQRIAMYPLLALTAVALLRGDAGVWRYGLPLSVPGLLISAYHVTIQYLPAAELTTCQGGVPCSARYLSVFGVVSIPVMAGAAFLLLSAVFLLLRSLERAA